MANYNATIRCPIPKEKAYAAIAEEMSAWWTPMSSKFLAVGDRAKTDFGGQSYWVFEAATLDAPDLIELDCCESHMVADDLSDPTEWLGTRLRFEITEEGNETTIHFTHIGLTPSMECYDLCKGGWDHFILGSLEKYLTGNGGQPNSYGGDRE